MRHLDLFSGIGGFALAARWVGWETVAFCEPDPYCQAVLRKHWPGVPIHDDVRELTGDAVGPVDIITGGYPCQPFSLAGKRRGANDDRHLWPAMFAIVRELRPDWVVGENVAGHVTMGLDDVLSDLEGIGYSARAFVVPACAVDARHQRNRVWIVANAIGTELREQSGRLCGSRRSRPAEPGEHGENRAVADPCCQRLQERPIDSGMESPAFNGGPWEAPAVRRWWDSEPDVGRVADGIPGRVDRIRALGNAIVPQVAAEVFHGIKQLTGEGAGK